MIASKQHLLCLMEARFVIGGITRTYGGSPALIVLFSFCSRQACRRLHDRTHPQLFLCGFKIGGYCVTRDAKYVRNFPSALSLRSPFQAFEFARGQRYSFHNVIIRELTTKVSMEVQSHQLEYACMRVYAGLEWFLMLIGSKG